MSEIKEQPTQESTLLYRLIFSCSVLVIVGQLFALILFQGEGMTLFGDTLSWNTVKRPFLYILGLPFLLHTILDLIYYIVHGSKYSVGKKPRDDLEILLGVQFFSLIGTAALLAQILRQDA